MPAKDPTETAPAAPVEPAPVAPASQWFRFDNSQPLIYVDRALKVAPGDVIEWPGGAPADGHWTPAPAPTQPDTKES